jgi:hypothetical protein
MRMRRDDTLVLLVRFVQLHPPGVASRSGRHGPTVHDQREFSFSEPDHTRTRDSRYRVDGPDSNGM